MRSETLVSGYGQQRFLVEEFNRHCPFHWVETEQKLAAAHVLGKDGVCMCMKMIQQLGLFTAVLLPAVV